MRVTAFALIAILCSAPAGANSFTKDGLVFESGHEIQWQPRHDGLIPDGSFEDGSCYDGQSGWACESDNSCDWITDLVPLGLWNYDGIHVAWLGGFCGGQATCWTRICQEIFFTGDTLTWWVMGYVSDGVGGEVSVTVDDQVIYEQPVIYFVQFSDFSRETVDVSEFTAGNHTLCFELDNTEHCGENMGDNVFFDYVELLTATGLPPSQDAEFSFSTVKTLY